MTLSQPHVIRHFSVDDARSAADVHEAACSSSWNAEAMESLLASPGVLGLGMMDSVRTNTMLAVCLARIAADEAELLTIATDPAYRRHGHASALLRELLVELRKRNVVRLYLEVGENNGPALSLYQGFGLESVARRKGYYEAGAIDAIVMARDLARASPASEPETE